MAQPRTPSPQPVNPLDALHQQAQKAKEDRERQIETLRARREAVEEERRKLADVQGHYDSKHARELQAINDEEQKLGAAVPTPPPAGPSQTPAPAPAGQPSDPDDSFSEVDKEKLQALLQDVPLADALLILGKSEAEVRQGLNIPDDQKLTTQLMLVHLSDDHESRLGRLEEVTGIKPHDNTTGRVGLRHALFGDHTERADEPKTISASTGSKLKSIAKNVWDHREGGPKAPQRKPRAKH